MVYCLTIILFFQEAVMAYIKERGNNNYFVRVSCGILDNGRPFQKSRLFRPSRVNLPESKVRKELDAFVKALEEECRIEFETKRQPQTNFELSKGTLRGLWKSGSM